MVYADPVPDEFASGRHYDEIGTDYYLSPDKLESDYSAVRFERELRLLRRYCPGGALLDVGCSSGGFLHQVRARFGGDYQGLGIDVSGPALDYARSRGLAVVNGNFPEHDFGAKTFDVITFWAVLEHLVAPGEFVGKAATLLKPRGVCLVLVPNLQSLASRLLGARYRYVYDQHLNYFTRRTLGTLVAPWFEPVAARFTHFNPVIIVQDWRSGGRTVSNQERAALLRRTTGYKQNRLRLPLRAAYSLTEMALGAIGLADNLALVLRKKSP